MQVIVIQSPQGLARDLAQAVRYQKGKLKDPLSVLDVPSERDFVVYIMYCSRKIRQY